MTSGINPFQLAIFFVAGIFVFVPASASASVEVLQIAEAFKPMASETTQHTYIRNINSASLPGTIRLKHHYIVSDVKFHTPYETSLIPARTPPGGKIQ